MDQSRVRFVSGHRCLHNAGDNLLDNRDEIKEKYYYAISKMVVRGYCSCYGHASRCLPDAERPVIENMVYGVCECVHNTKGKNCEQCQDLYNDREWKPAWVNEPNECVMCNCNGHAEKCRFDKAVFEATGHTSGGVCEDCADNTAGRQCEMCQPMFYRESHRSLRDPCLPCDCDPAGSLDEGLCDPHDEPMNAIVAGTCHCKANVEGRRCDRCKRGYWDFSADNPDGCRECSCNRNGTIGNLGCDMKTGECTCKRNVIGRDCNECAPHFYGLGVEEEGCKACDCDPGGSYDNNCHYETGQCKCRPHVTGRRCEQPESAHFSPYIDYLRYEGEFSRGSTDTQVTPRQPVSLYIVLSLLLTAMSFVCDSTRTANGHGPELVSFACIRVRRSSST